MQQKRIKTFHYAATSASAYTGCLIKIIIKKITKKRNQDFNSPQTTRMSFPIKLTQSQVFRFKQTKKTVELRTSSFLKSLKIVPNFNQYILMYPSNISKAMLVLHGFGSHITGSVFPLFSLSLFFSFPKMLKF